MQGTLSKTQSAQIQGIAILLMMWHHFFLDPSLYGDGFFLFPLAAFRFAWLARVTVSLYTFVSGYGIWFVLSRTRRRFAACMKRAAILYLRHIAGLTLLVLIPMWLRGGTVGAKRVLLNFSAVQTDLNGAMWYVLQYLIHMLLAPVLWYLFSDDEKLRRRTWLICGGVLLGVLCAVPAFPGARPVLTYLRDLTHPTMLAVFPAGYLCARYSLFERVSSYDKNRGLSAPLFYAVLCIAAIAIRMTLPDNTSNTRLDCLLMPVLVYGMAGLLKPLSGLPARTLTALGGLSTWIWIDHIPVFGRTGVAFIALGNDILFYAAELALNIPLAMLLRAAERRLVRVVRGARTEEVNV